MLYALYGLLDVERVEGLERDSEAVHHAYLTNHAVNAPQMLEKDRAAVQRALREGPRVDAVVKLDPVKAIKEFEAATTTCLPAVRAPIPRPRNAAAAFLALLSATMAFLSIASSAARTSLSPVAEIRRLSAPSSAI